MKFIVSIITLLFSMTIFSQELMIPKRLVQGNGAIRSGNAVGKFDKKYVGFFEKKDKLVFYNQSEKGKLSDGKPIALTDIRETLVFEDVVKLNENDIAILSSFDNKMQQTQYLYFRSVSAKSLSEQGDISIIASVSLPKATKEKKKLKDIFVRSSMLSAYNDGRGYRVVKRDGGYLAAVVHVTGIFGNEFIVTCLGYDENLTPQYITEVKVPVGEDNAELEHFIADETGNIYLLVSIDPGKNIAPKKVVVKVSNAGREEFQVRVDQSEDLIGTAKIGVSPDDRTLFYGGFGATKGRNGSTRYVIRTIDALTGETQSSINKAIPEKDIDAYISSGTQSDRKKEKKITEELTEKSGFRGMYIRNLFPLESGGCVIEGGHEWSVTTTTSNGRTSTSSTEYFDGLTYLMGFDSSLELKNTELIVRESRTSDPSRLTTPTASYVQGDSVYTIFNSVVGYLDVNQVSIPARYHLGAENALAIVKFSLSEKAEYNSLLDSRDKNKIFLTGNSAFLEKGNLLLPVCEKKEFGIGVLKFKKN